MPTTVTWAHVGPGSSSVSFESDPFDLVILPRVKSMDEIVVFVEKEGFYREPK